MKYNLLGNTGLKVSELCLGTMTFGSTGGRFAAINGVDQAGADALTRRSLDAGINFIDTANIYTEGQSEEMTGQALRNLGINRYDVVLATKVRGKMGDGPNDAGLTRKHIIAQAEASLKRLNTDYIDLYQTHSFDPLTPWEETLRALDDLVRSGKVRYLGASNVLAWQLMNALGISRLRAPRKVRVAASLLHHRGPRFGARAGAAAARPEAGPDGVEPAGRRLAQRQVHPRKPKRPKVAAAAENFDFPPVNKELAFNIMDKLRPMAAGQGQHRGRAGAGLAAAPAGGEHRHHRGQENGPAGRQPHGRGRNLHPRRS